MDIFMTVEALHSDAHPLCYNLCSSAAQQEVHYIEDNAVERDSQAFFNFSLDHHSTDDPIFDKKNHSTNS